MILKADSRRKETDYNINFPIFSSPIMVKNNDGTENVGEKQVIMRKIRRGRFDLAFTDINIIYFP